jgi:hypothetical protein
MRAAASVWEPDDDILRMLHVRKTPATSFGRGAILEKKDGPVAARADPSICEGALKRHNYRSCVAM